MEEQVEMVQTLELTCSIVHAKMKDPALENYCLNKENGCRRNILLRGVGCDDYESSGGTGCCDTCLMKYDTRYHQGRRKQLSIGQAKYVRGVGR